MVFHVDLNAVAVLGSDFFPARCRPPSGDRWLISNQVPIWSKDDSQERLFGVTLGFCWGLCGCWRPLDVQVQSFHGLYLNGFEKRTDEIGALLPASHPLNSSEEPRQV